MTSLGTLLVKHGWITKQQLGLAISKQREIGGRLGTCLLEMGALTEDLLNRALAEQQGVPSVSVEQLQEIPEKVVRLLPAPIAIRYRAIPFRGSASDVDFAMLEVDNLWLQDELAFIVGRRLNVFISNEARIIEALARYYRAPCSERFKKLLLLLDRTQQSRTGAQLHPESRLVHVDRKDEEARASTETSQSTPPLASDAAIPQAAATARPETRPSRDNRNEGRQTSEPQSTSTPASISIPVTVSELASLGTSPASPVGGAVPAQSPEIYGRDAQSGRVPSLEETEVAIETSNDPDQIGQLLVLALSQLLTRVVLLKVTPGGVRGWLAAGPGLDSERLEHFEVDFDEPSIFLNLREGGSFFLGTLPEMQSHLELAACWHKDLSDECAIFPVRVRERLVALVYGDSGPLGLADLDLDRVRNLCSSTARGLERAILERKKRRQQALDRD